MEYALFALVAVYALPSYVLAQTNTIIFSGSSTAITHPTTMPGMTCACVPAGTCMSSNNGIDIRIVNMGPKCNAGEVYCCSPPSGNLVDPGCGIRKIPVTQHPQGQASYGAYPWQVALLTTADVYIGSGVLIDKNHVLTVAHKVAGYAGASGLIKVRLGEWDGQSVSEPQPYQEFSIVRMFVHPNFNSLNLQNDVAVIRLNASVPVATSLNINTACLPTALPAANTRCWVSGWGKDAFGSNGQYQSIMKEVDVPILSQTACETSLRGTRLGQFFVFDKNSFICAGGEIGKDACTGDGGSPLVCQSATGQWEVVGMVAWGIGCATGGVPGVYVNVLNFIPWINQQISQT